MSAPPRYYTPFHYSSPSRLRRGEKAYLIHMLAKQETHITASNTELGLDPARLSTRVINNRSILVLLSAEAIVNPPMRSMIVGENIMEKTYLRQ
jgi:hypothetical protein